MFFLNILLLLLKKTFAVNIPCVFVIITSGCCTVIICINVLFSAILYIFYCNECTSNSKTHANYRNLICG